MNVEHGGCEHRPVLLSRSGVRPAPVGLVPDLKADRQLAQMGGYLPGQLSPSRRVLCRALVPHVLIAGWAVGHRQGHPGQIREHSQVVLTRQVGDAVDPGPVDGVALIEQLRHENVESDGAGAFCLRLGEHRVVARLGRVEVQHGVGAERVVGDQLWLSAPARVAGSNHRQAVSSVAAPADRRQVRRLLRGASPARRLSV